MTKSYKYSICFSGSGYHFPWQVGVGLYLQENYDLSDCCFVGVSAGSYIAILLAVGLSVEDYINKMIPEAFLIFNSSRTGSYLIAHGVIKSIMLKYMSETDYKKATEGLLVSLTRCRCSGFSNILVQEFESNEDVLEAICATSHIPYVGSPGLYYKFRGMKCMDGGFTHNWIMLDDETLMISPYKWSRKKYFYALTALFSNTLEKFNKLVKQGYEDARRHNSYFQKLPRKIRTQKKS
jgi:predicted patatin/cPLA2 family phospholipase